MVARYDSFALFQDAIRELLAAIPPVAQLDAKRAPEHNPATTHELRLSDVPGLTNVRIEFHGDTTRDALIRIAEGKIEDFILLGPQPGKKNWRFHSASTHELNNLGAADGMFAFVKR